MICHSGTAGSDFIVSYWEFFWALVLRAENNQGCVMAAVQRRVRVRVMGLGAG